MGGVIRNFGNPIYMHIKKHKCPTCKKELSVVELSKIVNSKSPEAKNYSFVVGDLILSGNVRFVWEEFNCSNCDLLITEKELRRFEREQREKERVERKK